MHAYESGQGWALSAHLGQLKQDKMDSRGDQIFFSTTCPGQVANKNPLVLRIFLLVPKYFSNCISSVRLLIQLFLIQNAIQIKLSCR